MWRFCSKTLELWQSFPLLVLLGLLNPKPRPKCSKGEPKWALILEKHLWPDEFRSYDLLLRNFKPVKFYVRENVYAGKIKATSAFLWFCKSPLCQPDSATRCSECPLLETLELLSILCGRFLAKLACVLTRKNVYRQTESHNFLCKNNVTFGKASFVNEVMLSVPCLSSFHLSAFLNHKVTQI